MIDPASGPRITPSVAGKMKDADRATRGGGRGLIPVAGRCEARRTGIPGASA